jgi:uncharacterized protein YoxC
MLQTIKTVVEIGAALAALALFVVGIYVILPYRSVPSQFTSTVAAWTPKAGQVDALIAKADNALPTAEQTSNTTQALVAAVNKIGAAGDTAGQAISDTSEQINRKCAGPDGPDACGTLATFSKATVKAGDAIVKTQLEEAAVTPHILAAVDSIKGDADDVNTTLRDAAIHDAAVNLSVALGNLATSEGTANAILLDVKKETDGMVAPKTNTQKLLEWAPSGLKLALIAGCIATHTTCP